MEAQGRGLIPAHAGKTPCNRDRPGGARAHPRSRGENSASPTREGLPSGSSPLTRGKPQHVAGHRLRDGLIPAHAGKTTSSMPRTSSSGAHPRSRGENRFCQGSGVSPKGSSPLTRGKRWGALTPDPYGGLIPAHAGKTPRRRRGGWTSGAHPRSRGENGPVRGCEAGAWGSSPLTRGKRQSRSPSSSSVGLIPAHAGKTYGWSCLLASLRAHPRSRGENSARDDDGFPGGGSSPLTRGKHLLLVLPAR